MIDPDIASPFWEREDGPTPGGVPRSAAQPDRQNGDGLRTFDTGGTILRRTVNVFTITCESAEIADRVADQLRTPQPTRDAAEGAGPHFNLAERLAEYPEDNAGGVGFLPEALERARVRAATPQPAPDAVRTLTPSQKAYALLWQEISDQPRIHEARRILLTSLTIHEQREAIMWVKQHYPVTEREILEKSP